MLNSRHSLKLLAVVLVFAFGYFNLKSPTPSFPRLDLGWRHANLLKNDSSPFTSVMWLASRSNFWGMFDTIEFPAFDAFNPSLVSLPQNNDNGNYSIVVIGRGEHGLEMVDGVGIHTPPIVAALFRLEDSANRGRDSPREFPRFQAHSMTHIEKLLTHSNDLRLMRRCDYLPDYIHNIDGPEDARVLWSALGEPLVIYNSVAPENSELCRVLYLVDLRAALPDVESFFSSANELPPIRFNEPIPLILPDQTGIQKNWVPFTNTEGEVFIHVDLFPQAVYKLNVAHTPTFSSPASELSLALEPVATYTPDDPNCIDSVVEKGPFHQSSPFLEVILCTSAQVSSGSCDPDDPNNKIYIGVIHRVHGMGHQPYYEPRIVSLNSSAPFNYVSVSKPLIYMGTDQSQQIYTTSINFRKACATHSSSAIARGYLDDWLMVSFGIWDKSCNFIEVRVEEVLRGHTMCKDVIKSIELWER